MGFAYGGCGGNGNRFMCKEMCERHCVSREEQQLIDPRKCLAGSGTEIGCCCLKLKVKTETRTGAFQAFRERFQIYTYRPAPIEEKDHWVSVDGKFAIWQNKGKWIIGPIEERAISGGEPLARIKKWVIRSNLNVDCPKEIEYGWKYWALGDLNDANADLKVVCSNDDDDTPPEP